METISVIIPVYNHLQKLKDSLHTVFGQTYKNLEIIVVDDGSSTPVSDFLKTEEKERVDKIIRQENKGAPSARNKGYKASSGDYIIFWDGDIIAKPDMLNKLKEELEQNPQASYSYCNYKIGWKKMPAQEFDPKALKKKNYIHTTSLIQTKDAILWDEDLNRFQDWDYWLTLLEQEKGGVWVDEYLFKILSKNGGMSEWMPSFFYKPPFKYIPGIKSKVEKYERAREKVVEKHNFDINY